MSFVIAVPEFLSAAATDLANLGSTISAANAAASIPTTGVLAAGADDVSAAIAALFGAHAQAYQTISAQAATFHAQFVQTLSAGAGAYANAEAANVQQSLLNAINAPTQALLGRPLIVMVPTGRRPGKTAGRAGCCMAMAVMACRKHRRRPRTGKHPQRINLRRQHRIIHQPSPFPSARRR